MKFKIKNEAHSKAIQERLFEMGYKWSDNGYSIMSDNSYDYLGANSDMTLSFLVGEFSYYKPTTLDELYEKKESLE